MPDKAVEQCDGSGILHDCTCRPGLDGSGWHHRSDCEGKVCPGCSACKLPEGVERFGFDRNNVWRPLQDATYRPRYGYVDLSDLPAIQAQAKAPLEAEYDEATQELAAELADARTEANALEAEIERLNLPAKIRELRYAAQSIAGGFPGFTQSLNELADALEALDKDFGPREDEDGEGLNPADPSDGDATQGEASRRHTDPITADRSATASTSPDAEVQEGAESSRVGRPSTTVPIFDPDGVPLAGWVEIDLSQEPEGIPHFDLKPKFKDGKLVGWITRASRDA